MIGHPRTIAPLGFLLTYLFFSREAASVNLETVKSPYLRARTRSPTDL